ncbi:anaerobic sulfatase maturase [Methanoculleus sp. Wushi-C6]|uniref:Anaerobic sulfatase maturase n=1 Tax=Methanoculleus caldifontis TaxID=2651577 RepID=A0ABU3X4B3_9EURY|nr:anaerobic sulfatase maturase [Methanoculleus sp. Wushi-C6]MDV2482776.1 anaerobic sulfatase maturase [Methanoculleus sp. Wushi-C6]
MNGSNERALPAFHVMAKPTGTRCNLDCAYCFYRTKEGLYPESDFRMTDTVMEEYIRQTLAGHRVPHVTIAWQGGEPTLMGLDFFRRAVAVQKKYAGPKTRIENTFQTNGILLDDDWCRFFHDNRFLVGLSMDGPRELHDVYRRDRQGRGTFDRVIKAARLLQKHRVEFNILCAVNSMNADYPLEVYRFFRDELDARYIQFIPIVERANEGKTVTDRSVRPDQWGRFLTGIFDEWIRRDVGRTFLLNFDWALAGWFGMVGTVCVFAPTCGLGVALEHNGDLYSCDHFVEPDHLLGNILTTPLGELVNSEKQRRFGAAKRDTLPRYCRECNFLAVCNGECQKNRFVETPDGEAGLNYLCEGYRTFFAHADRPMRMMAGLLRQGRYADEVMPMLAAKVGRNEPCPCGSGLKYKKCCGRPTAPRNGDGVRGR